VCPRGGLDVLENKKSLAFDEIRSRGCPVRILPAPSHRTQVKRNAVANAWIREKGLIGERKTPEVLEEEAGTRGHVAGMEQMVNADRTSAGNSQGARRKFCA